MTTVADPPEIFSPAGPPTGKTPALAGPLSRWRSIQVSDQVLIAVLILLAVLCYGNSLFNAFVYDDEQQILQNPYVKSWHYLPQIFTTTVWSFVGAAGTTNYYRPLMTFTYLILWQAFKDIPFGFHLFNITLNAAVVVLVFAAGLRLFRDRRVAWVGAALFAIHPVHTEVVDWIAAVPELEVTFFVLLTFWFFAQLDKNSWKFQIATVASFALAVLCKEPALMFAPLAISFEHFVRPDNSGTSVVAKLRRYAPLCVVAAVYLLLRIALFGKLAPVLQHPKITWPQTIYSAFALVAEYTKYLFWPAPLSAFHVFHSSVSPWELPVLAGISIFCAAVALIFYLRKRAPAAAFCILWMGITIAPVLNARWMASNVFTERYLYLPSVGFCWLVAWYGLHLWNRGAAKASWSRGILATAAIVIVLMSVVSIVRRNAIWRDDMTLYTRTLQTDPDAAVIRSNRASLYFDALQYDKALPEWQLALAQKPDNVVTMNALGLLYTRLRRNDEAEAMFQQAIAAKPLWGDSHFSRALLLQKTGHLSEALVEFKTGVTLSPLSAPAHRWYGEALLENNQRDEAVAQFQQAVELDPTLEAMHDLSELYILQGRNADAEPVIRRIIAQFPYDSSAHLMLGNLLEQASKRDQAANEFRAVLNDDPNNTEAKAALQRLKP
jgi:tetratricopeptide (TPR) repeat protein